MTENRSYFLEAAGVAISSLPIPVSMPHFRPKLRVGDGATFLRSRGGRGGGVIPQSRRPRTGDGPALEIVL
jgi:hypothetical protein